MSSFLSSLKEFKLPWRRAKPDIDESQEEEAFFRAGQWQLVWWKFKRHKLAQIAVVALGTLYVIAILAEFVAPHPPLKRYKDFVAHPPSDIHIRDVDGAFHLPFIYATVRERDPVTFRPFYAEDTSQRHPIKLLVRGDPYELWGLISSDLHLFGTENNEAAPLFVLGSDSIGRDVLSRIFFGGRISLSMGLVGVFLAFFLGLILGGISGYYGGIVDEAIQRVVEVLFALPPIPLWMALAAALPQDWPQVRVYFYTTIILSLLTWPGLARIVRGRLLSMREEDFVMAARLDGESEWRIIRSYMLPSFMSVIIVSLTLAIPGMIIAETALSFLGIGLKSPTVSWGVMLNEAQDIMVVAQLPWVLWPVAFVVVAVLMFNFMGDGLRDAADPYTT
jgi:peptide/nickel transport system permease protein